ncbi:hypothetical protein DSM21852_27670 [Methylocystis bryophila]|nr:hypothetical protein DSM21852_27670 [Methylocystis bryophila]
MRQTVQNRADHIDATDRSQAKDTGIFPGSPPEIQAFSLRRPRPVAAHPLAQKSAAASASRRASNQIEEKLSGPLLAFAESDPSEERSDSREAGARRRAGRRGRLRGDRG